MNANELEILGLLGYGKTHEDGALLENPSLRGADRFVWPEDSFRKVVERHNARYAEALKHRIANHVLWRT